MNITKLDINTTSGNFTIELDVRDSELQATLKDLLLAKMLNEKQITNNSQYRNEAGRDSKPSKTPIIKWDAYTKGVMRDSSKGMGARLLTEELLSDQEHIKKEALLDYLDSSLQGVKRNSIDTYINGMVAAGMLQRSITNRDMLSLTDEFINQQNGELA